MTAVDAAPDFAPTRVEDSAVLSFRAMASPITLTVLRPGPDGEACLERAAAVIRDVEHVCSRFDVASALSRANAEPSRWHDVPATLVWAVEEAHRAYRETGGIFDPRVLSVLLSWGYDRSLPFAAGGIDRTPASIPAAATPGRPDSVFPWWPDVARGDRGWRLNLAGQPIDLGGIGKGLAVRWAAAELVSAGQGYCVDVGGDCAVGGVGPDGDGWQVGVEDPADPSQLVLVLDLADTGCGTSSTRLRRWRVGGVPVHHLVDPRTRRPGGDGLSAVTVVATDPAWSEVWSKTLFLTGAAEIRARAERLGLAAAWVEQDGTVGTTGELDPMVVWRRADA
jgi:thiamine biosynthesis lipoprotein